MRISREMRYFIKQKVEDIDKSSQVFLFGSRTDDEKVGGDIDILILSDLKLTFKQKQAIRIDFIKQFGEQKIDLINYSFHEDSAFKQIALLEAIKL